MIGGNHTVAIEVTRGGVLRIRQRLLVTNDVDDDARLRRRQHPRFGNLGGAVRPRTQTLEPGAGQQCETGIRTARPDTTWIMPADTLGQRPNRRDRDLGVFTAHRRGHHRHPVTVVIHPDRTILVGPAAAFSHRVRIMAKHNTVGQITNRSPRPHPLPTADGRGDRLIHRTGILLPMTQIGTGDDRRHLARGEQPVTQTLPDPGQAITHSDGLPQQLFRSRLGNGQRDRHPRRALSKAIHTTQIALSRGFHQPRMQLSSNPQGVPGQIGMTTLGLTQRQHQIIHPADLTSIHRGEPHHRRRDLRPHHRHPPHPLPSVLTYEPVQPITTRYLTPPTIPPMRQSTGV